MKFLYLLLLLPLSVAVWQDRSVHPLTDNLGSRHGGNYTFTARVINRSDNHVAGGTAVLENVRSREIITASLGSTQLAGDLGNATIGVRGDRVNLIGWSPIDSQGNRLGVITDKQGAYALIGTNWYRIESIEAFAMGTDMIGRVAYGKNSIERLDPN